jgi:hypothetical protein
MYTHTHTYQYYASLIHNNINIHTAIPIRIEGHETAFNGFQYQLTTGKPLKLTLNYYENGSANQFWKYKYYTYQVLQHVSF